MSMFGNDHANHLQFLKVGRKFRLVYLTVVCVAGGYRLHFCDAETQKKGFEMHFPLAERLQLPMFLHCRAAAADMVKILTSQRCGLLRSVGLQIASMRGWHCLLPFDACVPHLSLSLTSSSRLYHRSSVVVPTCRLVLLAIVNYQMPCRFPNKCRIVRTNQVPTPLLPSTSDQCCRIECRKTLALGLCEAMQMLSNGWIQ